MAIKNGIPLLEILGVPDSTPTKEMGILLLNNTVSMCTLFKETYNIEFMDPDALKKVESIILNKKEITDRIDWEFLLQASAFMGDLFKKHFGGKWSWYERINGPAVIELKGQKGTAFNVLHIVA